MRESEMEEDAIPRFVAAGYHEDDVRRWLPVYRQQAANPNPYVDMRMPGGNNFR